jgi:hypothetical protein
MVGRDLTVADVSVKLSVSMSELNDENSVAVNPNMMFMASLDLRRLAL